MLTTDYISALYLAAHRIASPAEQFRIKLSYGQWFDYEICSADFYQEVNASLTYSANR